MTAHPGIYGGYYMTDDDKDEEPIFYEGDAHGLVVSPTGKGKTTKFNVVAKLCGKLDGSSIIENDPKGQNYVMVAEYFHRKNYEVSLIDPYGVVEEIVETQPDRYRYLKQHGLTKSVGFNPLRGLADAGRRQFDRVVAINNALIAVKGNEPHWPESSQSLGTWGTLLELRRHGDKANLPNVRRMLMAAERKEMIDKKEIPVEGYCYEAATAVEFGRAMGNANGAAMASLAGRFITRTDEINSIVSNYDTQTRNLLSPPLADDMCLPGYDFARPKEVLSYVAVVLPAEEVENHHNWLRMAFTTAFRELSRKPGGIHTVILIDELPVLGHLKALTQAFTYIRDFNVRIVGIAQDLNQLKRIYKDDEYLTLISNCGFLLFWGPNDPETAKWLSEYIGQTTVVSENITGGKSLSKAKGRSSQTGYSSGGGLSLPKSMLPAFLAGQQMLSEQNGQSSGSGTSDTETSVENDGFSRNETARALYLPHQLRGLPNDTAMLMLAGLSFPVKVRLPLYRDIEPCASRAAPNPYYTGK